MREDTHSYSLAVRWIRFLLGVELKSQNCGGKTIAKRLGMSGPEGWTRFVIRVVGRSPNQLPNLTIETWAREGVARVFLAPIQAPKPLPSDLTDQ